jgi:C-terminal processing protease CtpA/Prc
VLPAYAEVALDPSAAPQAVLDEIERIVREDFYDPKGLAGFDSAESRFRDVVESKGGVDEAAAGWLATLRASHTGRYAPDRIDYYELADIFARGLGRRLRTVFPPEGEVVYPGIGVVPRRIDGKTFTADVYDGSPAARAGLKPGDEILSVDGAPYSEIGSFEGKAGKQASVKLRRSREGAPLTISVPVEKLEPNETLNEAIRASVRIIEEGGRRIGYLRLWSFASRGAEDVVMELLASEPLVSADGLVLDMRGRWGGAPADAADIFLGRAPLVEMTNREGDTGVVNARWRKPIVGIIDEGSRSGMEILAHGLKSAGVPLVGSPTAGAVLAGRAFLLRDNSLLLLAVLDVRVDGERLEGAGVTPDIEVPYELPYAAGADPQHDRAVEEMRRILAD